MAKKVHIYIRDETEFEALKAELAKSGLRFSTWVQFQIKFRISELYRD